MATGSDECVGLDGHLGFTMCYVSILYIPFFWFSCYFLFSLYLLYMFSKVKGWDRGVTRKPQVCIAHGVSWIIFGQATAVEKQVPGTLQKDPGRKLEWAKHWIGIPGACM
jgi:hypothetical protein